MCRSSDRNKPNYDAMPKIGRSSKNKKNKSLRKAVAHSLCSPSSYNLGRAASPPLPSRTPIPFPVTVFSCPTCDVLFSPLFFPSNHSLCSLPFSLPHLDVLVFAHLVPSLEALTPPAGLFPLNSCTPAPAAFQLLAAVLLPRLPHSQSILFCHFTYMPHDLHARVQALSVPESLVPLYQIRHLAHSNSSTLNPAPPVTSIHVVSEWISFRSQL